MYNKPIVCCDIDDTIFSNFIEILLSLYNKKYNDNLSLSQITEWNIYKFIKPECKSIFEEFVNDKFFEQIVIPQETVKTLCWINDNFNLYFVTSGYADTMKARNKVLEKYLPFYNWKQLVMLNNKNLFECDIIIDDCLGNLQCLNRVNICIDKPYNKLDNNQYHIIVDKFHRIKEFGEIKNILKYYLEKTYFV